MKFFKQSQGETIAVDITPGTYTNSQLEARQAAREKANYDTNQDKSELSSDVVQDNSPTVNQKDYAINNAGKTGPVASRTALN